MLETRKEVRGYEGLYEMTLSGRVFSIKRQRFLERCNDEYVFHNYIRMEKKRILMSLKFGRIHLKFKMFQQVNLKEHIK